MIYLGADHGGYALKETIKEWLQEWNLEYTDMGPMSLDPNDDYPVYAFAVAEQVGGADDAALPWGQRPKGILLCRSAIGVVMAANKVKHVRAAAATDVKAAEHARTNDDVNVLGLSGDWMTPELAKQILQTWLTTEFSGEARHLRRIELINAFEQR